MTKVVIRHATKADAAEIATIHVRAWQATYVGIMPQQFLDTLSTKDRCVQWQQAIEQGNGDTLIAEKDGMVAGFLNIGLTRDEDLASQHCGEVRAIYVNPSLWRIGIGTPLFSAGLDNLRTQGYGEMRLWVATKNTIGLTFYESKGMRWDGTTRLENIGQSNIEERRYRLILKF